MAIRLTIDGVHIECDTPQEVAALILTAKPIKELPQTRTTPLYARHSRARRAATGKTHPSGIIKPGELSEPRTFKGNHLDILTGMKEAFPNGVSSDQLAARIGGTRRSIPIIMVALQTYAKKNNVRFDDLVIRQKPPKGAKGSTYSLTPRGLKEFFG